MRLINSCRIQYIFINPESNSQDNHVEPLENDEMAEVNELIEAGKEAESARPAVARDT